MSEGREVSLGCSAWIMPSFVVAALFGIALNLKTIADHLTVQAENGVLCVAARPTKESMK